MSLSGNFHKYVKDEFGLYCTWSGSQSQSGNYTNVTVIVYLRYWTIDVGQRANAKITVNGETYTYTAPEVSDLSASSYTNKELGRHTFKVYHNADGTKINLAISASWNGNLSYGGVDVSTITASTTVSLNSITVYKLSVSKGSNSNAVVERLSSGFGSKGTLASGAILYKGDMLRISFSASTNYNVSTHTVNGSTFTSGNTHTVSGNVTVVSTAVQKSTAILATDANVGSVSVITLQKGSSSNYCSIKYTFKGTTGYLTKDGALSASEVRFTNSSVSFRVPTSFYDLMPNSKREKCTLECKTYTSTTSTMLGTASSCEFYVTAVSSPTVSAIAYDTNANTIALTGNSNILVKYKSNVKIDIECSSNNGATIASKYVNGSAVTGNSVTIQNSSSSSFTVKVVDSRGYETTTEITPTMIEYSPVTINPVIERESSTSDIVYISLSGNMYSGSFGAYNNSLSVKYRYKYSNGAFSDWNSIPLTNVLFSDGTYRTVSKIQLPSSVDYNKSCDFEVEASDGSSAVVLTSAVKKITLPKGTPVFDWGENDFNVNVPLMYKGTNKLLYTDGDSITVTVNSTGYITTSKSDVWFCVPLAKPVIGCSGATITHNQLRVRQNNGYHYGSSGSTSVTADGISISSSLQSGNHINICYHFPTSSIVDTTINNDSCGIVWSGTITFIK